MASGGARSWFLLNVAVPLAWAALQLVRLAAPAKGDLIASVAGRTGATLADVRADARWWLQRDGRGAPAHD